MTDDDLIALMESLGLEPGTDWRLAKVDGKVEIIIGRHAMQVLAQHAPDQEAAKRVLSDLDDTITLVLTEDDGVMSCTQVRADGSTGVLRLKFWNTHLGAQREATGELISQGYRPVDRTWQGDAPRWTRRFRRTP